MELMPRSRSALLAVLGLRIAYGVGLLAVPDRLSKRWLGEPSDPTRVALRGLGAREVVLHGLALASALRDGPVRPFLAASIAGDLSDIAATAAARRGLPSGSPAATTIVAGASAALTAAVAAGTEH
jgi:hypothetical protein